MRHAWIQRYPQVQESHTLTPTEDTQCAIENYKKMHQFMTPFK